MGGGLTTASSSMVTTITVYSIAKMNSRGKSHVNGIENFWSFAKRRLAKFNGCASAAFALHLKEWRYNHRSDNLLALIKQFVYEGCSGQERQRCTS